MVHGRLFWWRRVAWTPSPRWGRQEGATRSKGECKLVTAPLGLPPHPARSLSSCAKRHGGATFSRKGEKGDDCELGGDPLLPWREKVPEGRMRGAAYNPQPDLSPSPKPPAYSPHHPAWAACRRTVAGEPGGSFASPTGPSPDGSVCATGPVLLQKPALRGGFRLIFYLPRGESRLGVRSLAAILACATMITASQAALWLARPICTNFRQVVDTSMKVA